MDSCLEEFLSHLIAIVREAGTPTAANDESLLYRDTQAPKRLVAMQAFKYIYMLVKVRGYKNVVSKLPHEVR